MLRMVSPGSYQYMNKPTPSPIKSFGPQIVHIKRNCLASWRVNIAGWQDYAIISKTVVDYLRTFEVLRVTAAQMRAFNASSSILSPS
jgi:hypothetical protein